MRCSRSYCCPFLAWWPVDRRSRSCCRHPLCRDDERPVPIRVCGCAIRGGKQGLRCRTEFSVATAKTYTFYLNLHFREGDSQNKERVRKLAGTGAYRDGRQIDTGLAIPVRLRVERIGNIGASSIFDRMFTNHDLEGTAADHFSKLITRIRLEPGRYRARVEALENIPELEDISVHFSMLVAYDRGGP